MFEVLDVTVFHYFFLGSWQFNEQQWKPTANVHGGFLL